MYSSCRWDIIDHDTFCTRFLGIKYRGIGLAFETHNLPRIQRWLYRTTRTCSGAPFKNVHLRVLPNIPFLSYFTLTLLVYFEYGHLLCRAIGQDRSVEPFEYVYAHAGIHHEIWVSGSIDCSESEPVMVDEVLDINSQFFGVGNEIYGKDGGSYSI